LGDFYDYLYYPTHIRGIAFLGGMMLGYMLNEWLFVEFFSKKVNIKKENPLRLLSPLSRSFR
jgi:hypothetical protein